MKHGWQSESTDGPKGGRSCVCWRGCNGCSGHLTTTVGCSVVSRSCSCVVVVPWWSGVVAVMCNKCGAVTVAVVVVVVVVVWCNQRIVL